MSTIITKTCAQCGYRYSTSVYGYIADNMGCTLVKCNKCGGLSRDAGKMEWIQRTDKQKKRVIAPRNPVYALFISFFFLLIVYKLGLMDMMEDVESSGIILMTIAASIAVFFIPTLYLLNRMSVNSEQFINRYINSIKRSREPEYRALLEKMGPLYSEDLPAGMKFSDSSREFIDEALEKKYESPLEFIPSIQDSIVNS